MSKLNFINKMTEYENEMKNNINRKNAMLNDLQMKVNDKQKEINNKQDEYNLKSSDDLFQQLLILKRELNDLKANVKNADDIIQILPAKQVSQEDVTKDIENYIEDLNLRELKSNIQTAKQAFIDSIDIFDNKIKELIALKEEIRPLNIDKGMVLQTLEKYKGLYSCNDELTYNWDDIDFKKARMAQQAVNIYFDRNFSLNRR